MYLANSGEPKRRSSSSISSSGASREELEVQGDDLVVQMASGEERRAWGPYIGWPRLTVDSAPTSSLSLLLVTGARCEVSRLLVGLV